VKSNRQRKASELQTLPLLSKLFKLIIIDFIIDLPPSTNTTIDVVYDSLLVIIDRYTKVARYILCYKTTTAEELAELFIKSWVKDHGILASIITDRGSLFTSKFWSAMYYHLYIRRNLLTAFYL
jgi:hypothetical protein